MLHQADNIFIPRPLYGFPADQTWQTKPGVTLLGDAAHLMPPFAAQGANMAMLDAVELYECLTSKSFASMTEAIRSYERNMLRRTSEAILNTMAAQDRIMAESPDILISHILKTFETKRPIVKPAIP